MNRVTVFTVGGVDYGVAGTLRRTLPVPSPLPALFEHEARSFPVLDLPGLLTDRTAEAEPWLLLIEDGAGQGEALRRALVVEELRGVEAFEPEAVQPVPAIYPAAERSRFRGLVPRADGSVLVLLRLAGLPAGPGES